jgi:hypothetical protein
MKNQNVPGCCGKLTSGGRKLTRNNATFSRISLKDFRVFYQQTVELNLPRLIATMLIYCFFGMGIKIERLRQ